MHPNKNIIALKNLNISLICFIKELLTFQLQHGTNIASKKTPSNGPEVADVTNIDDSITPDNKPTPKLIPMMTNPYTTLIALMAYNWCLSLSSLKEGLIKSSKVTVAKEFKLDTFKLQINK